MPSPRFPSRTARGQFIARMGPDRDLALPRLDDRSQVGWLEEQTWRVASNQVRARSVVCYASRGWRPPTAHPSLTSAIRSRIPSLRLDRRGCGDWPCSRAAKKRFGRQIRGSRSASPHATFQRINRPSPVGGLRFLGWVVEVGVPLASRRAARRGFRPGAFRSVAGITSQSGNTTRARSVCVGLAGYMTPTPC